MQQKHVRIMMIPLLVMAGLFFVQAPPVHAQPFLVTAFPGPDQVLDFAPQSISLTFDRAIAEEDLSVTVTNGAGESMASGGVTINESNRFKVGLPLLPLPNGIYTVTYRVRAIGGAVVVSDSYEFTVALPEPKLYLIEPIDGEPVFSDTVNLLMRIESVSFDYYDTRINVYLDGELVDTVKSLEYTLSDLEEGVRRIKVVMAQFDYELPATEKIVHIPVVSEEESQELLEEMGFILTPARSAITILASSLLLLAGYMVARSNRKGSSPDGEEG